jgi:hypothetical protein
VVLATPRGRYSHGLLSDFSLMDAIESGIVKLPRVPVADNIPGGDAPKFRNIWEYIRTKMPKKGRGKAETLDPLSLPTTLITALDALYGHYEKTFEEWTKHGVKVPPCFIIVCNNTSASKLVYDYISGFHRPKQDGSTELVNGRLELFRNFDEYGNPLARPRTLLIETVKRSNPAKPLTRISARWPAMRSSAFAARSSSVRAIASAPKTSPIRNCSAGHEHGRQARPTGRIDPLRRLCFHAD